ncbi:MAG: UDP-glucose 4-epimerase [Rhizobiales bacterium PAR1]|nr:MAG: UDP-glucose 4-epimerase [Rhizobiales bacterium PAR1]
MSVLVTGAGVIGGLTAELLAARGERVVVIDIRTPPSLPDGVTFETCDISDFDALANVLSRHGITRVIHTAAMLSTGIRKDPLSGIRVNVMGTANLLDLARETGLKRVVLASSTTVAYTTFGGHGPGPMIEDEPLRLISQRPASLYAASKLAGEHLALLYRDLYGVDVVSLRYGAVIGGSLEHPTSVPGRLLAVLVAGVRAGKRVVLDDPLLLWGGREEFIDARDCARANLAALDAGAPKQGVYNVASGHWHTLGEFVDAVRQNYPGLDVEFPHTINTGFAGFLQQRPAPSSTGAAARELGFTAAYPLSTAIVYWAAPRAEELRNDPTS